jgi:quercetin dioxygenase-like cupin family protein
MASSTQPTGSASDEKEARLMFDMKQFTDEYASILDMQDWANEIMESRKPDFVIGGTYMDRWYVIPRNAGSNLYLHCLKQSDEPIMHDHPWNSTSYIIAGGFTEHTPEGSFLRSPGDIVQRKAEDLHWLELQPGYQSVSLFFTGPKIRDWGFQCGDRWVDWQTFTGGYHNGRSERGAGCGEP